MHNFKLSNFCMLLMLVNSTFKTCRLKVSCNYVVIKMPAVIPQGPKISSDSTEESFSECHKHVKVVASEQFHRLFQKFKWLTCICDTCVEPVHFGWTFCSLFCCLRWQSFFTSERHPMRITRKSVEATQLK